MSRKTVLLLVLAASLLVLSFFGFRLTALLVSVSVGNASLTVWDSTEASPQLANVLFYANYSKSGTGGPITPGYPDYGRCDINISDAPSTFYEMAYNSSSSVYEFNKTFYTAGIYYFSVNCSSSFYTALSATDDINVTDAAPNISIQSPVNGTSYSTNSIDLNYTVSDDVAIDSCWLTTASETFYLPGCSNISGTVYGNLSVTVWVNDSSGNQNSETVYFSTPNLGWVCDDPYSCQYANLSACLTAANNTNSSCRLVQANSSHTIEPAGSKFNISDPDLDGVIIFAGQNISVDCAGALLSGPAPGTAVNVSAAAADAVLENCAISGYGSADNTTQAPTIAVGAANALLLNNTIENSTATYPNGPTVALQAANATFANNTLRKITGAGSIVRANGSFANLSGNRITGIGNATTGISVAGPNCSISLNDMFNLSTAIALSSGYCSVERNSIGWSATGINSSGDSFIANNTIYNSAVGIAFEDGDAIINNTIFANATVFVNTTVMGINISEDLFVSSEGILTTGAPYSSVVAYNSIENITNFGIALFDGNNNTIALNRVRNSRFVGAFVAGDKNSVIDNDISGIGLFAAIVAIDGHNFTRNNISSSGGGLVLVSNGRGNFRVSGNRLERNDYGVLALSTAGAKLFNLTITNNSISRNRVLGVLLLELDNSSVLSGNAIERNGELGAFNMSLIDEMLDFAEAIIGPINVSLPWFLPFASYHGVVLFGSNATIFGNSINFNSQAGIVVINASRPRIINNTICGNALGLIELEGGDALEHGFIASYSPLSFDGISFGNELFVDATGTFFTFVTINDTLIPFANGTNSFDLFLWEDSANVHGLGAGTNLTLYVDSAVGLTNCSALVSLAGGVCYYNKPDALLAQGATANYSWNDIFNASYYVITNFSSPPSLNFISNFYCLGFDIAPPAGGESLIEAAPVIATMPALLPSLEPEEVIEAIMEPGTAISFAIDTARHELRLLQLNATTAFIELSSSPIRLTLDVGKSAAVDLNGDGIDDVSVTLLKIEADMASLRVARLSVAPAPSPPAAEVPEKVLPVEEAKPEEAKPAAVPVMPVVELPELAPKPKFKLAQFLSKNALLLVILSLVVLMAALAALLRVRQKKLEF